MSLRTRLVVSLAVVLALALLASGALILGLTRAGLVERMDGELLTIATASTRIERLAQLTERDSEAGRRLAVLRLDRRGMVTHAWPSGFASEPDPLPDLRGYAGTGVPNADVGVVLQVPSVDGSMEYRVLIEDGPRDLGAVAIAAPMSDGRGGRACAGRGTLVVVGASAMGLLLLVAWLLIRRGLLPLERMTRTAEGISAGDLSHRAGDLSARRVRGGPARAGAFDSHAGPDRGVVRRSSVPRSTPRRAARTGSGASWRTRRTSCGPR